MQELVSPSGVLKELTAVAVDDGNGEIYIATTTAVYEFGPEGSFRGDITGVPREGIPTGVKGQNEEVPFNRHSASPASLAVAPESHTLFVGVSGTQVGPKNENLAVVDVFGPDVVVPDPETKAPFDLELETGGAGGHSWGILATGTVNPDSAGEASCSFAWGTSKQALNRVAPCEGMVSEGDTPTPVDASLNGLAPDTTYYYRLEARNEHGTNQGEESQDYEFTTPGPGLDSESVSAVSSSSAALEATVAPHDASEKVHDLQGTASSPTTYYFQYSKGSMEGCAANPSACVNVPLVPASTGGGIAGVEVEQKLLGLASGTTYHYRVVAMNEALPKVVPGLIPTAEPGVQIAFYGPDRTFTAQGPGKPAALPDGRVWELVSPVNKHGAKIEGEAWASVDGSDLAFVTGTPSTSSPAGYDGNGNQVLSSRVTPGAWSSVDISLSHSSPVGVLAGVRPEYRFFSEDLGLAIAESLGPFSVPEGQHKNKYGEWQRITEAFPIPTERTPYMRHDATCESTVESNWSTCYEPLLDVEDTSGGEPHEGSLEANESRAKFVAATPDGSHVVISSFARLTATSVTGAGPWLYEWSVDKPASERLSLVSVLPDGTAASSAGLLALSEDGSRLIFGVQEGLAEAGNTYWKELYLRDVARGGTGETVRLDLNEAGVPEVGNKVLQGASADGSTVFFTDTAALTKDAGSGGEVGDTLSAICMRANSWRKAPARYDVPSEISPPCPKLVGLAVAKARECCVCWASVTMAVTCTLSPRACRPKAPFPATKTSMLHTSRRGSGQRA